MQNLREAASIVTDMDAYLADDGKDHATDHRIEEKIKRERAIQEKSGWLDCTEVKIYFPCFIMFSFHFGRYLQQVSGDLILVSRAEMVSIYLLDEEWVAEEELFLIDMFNSIGHL